MSFCSFSHNISICFYFDLNQINFNLLNFTYKLRLIKFSTDFHTSWVIELLFISSWFVCFRFSFLLALLLLSFDSVCLVVSLFLDSSTPYFWRIDHIFNLINLNLYNSINQNLFDLYLAHSNSNLFVRLVRFL